MFFRDDSHAQALRALEEVRKPSLQDAGVPSLVASWLRCPTPPHGNWFWNPPQTPVVFSCLVSLVSNICETMFKHEFSGIKFSGICSCILSVILFRTFSDIWSDIYSDISIWHSICHIFSQSFWNAIWQSIWHSILHLLFRILFAIPSYILSGIVSEIKNATKIGPRQLRSPPFKPQTDSPNINQT